MGIESIIKWMESMIYEPKETAISTETALCNEMAREAIAFLKTHPEAQPNEPLTLEELRMMGGKPVWCEELQCWGIVKYETVGAWKNKPFLAGVWQNPDFETAVSFEYDIKSRGLTLYHRPPKED